MTQVHLSNGASNSWVGDEYSSQLVEQIVVMVEKEETFYSCVDYLGELPESNNDLINEGWRQKAAEWMFKVIDFYVREECAFVCKYNCYIFIANRLTSHFVFVGGYSL